METMFLLTLRTLQHNKKRTLLTVFTIILSVGMITSVLCGGFSMLCFLQEKEAVYAGDYAYCMEITSQAQVKTLLRENNVADVSLLRFAGNSFYGEPDNRTLLSVAEINASFVKNFFLEQYLLDGRFPKTENEIVLTRDFLDTNSLSFSVGDTIELSLGTRVWDEIHTPLYGLVNFLGERESFHPTETRTYTIVGIVSEMKNSKTAGDFNAYSGLRDNGRTLTAYVKCKKLSKAVYSQAEEYADAIGGEVSSFHSDFLLYYGVSTGKGAIKMTFIVISVILLLMAACSAMICNVLSISLQERIWQLGMLSSIGATDRQKKSSVTMEAFLLGIFGIPFGLLAGIGLTAAVLAIIRAFFQTSFSFGFVRLSLHLHWFPLLLGAVSGVSALFFACKVPGKIASKVTVMDTLKQTTIYNLKQPLFSRGKVMSLLFGVCGALASKNIHRNPKRFRAITLSIILAVVLGLSLYSFSDFMMLQTSMQMKEDGSNYTDVSAFIQYKELKTAVTAISDKGIAADISCRIPRYMTAELDDTMKNPNMAGYFINGTLAEFYVVGIDTEHFEALCKENQIDYTTYEGKSDFAILLNSATGNYGASPNRIVTGTPLVIETGTQLTLKNYEDDGSRTIIVQDIVTGENQNIASQFVRNIPVLLLPITFYDWLINEETYLDLSITTQQHAEVTKCLADMGFFQVVDAAKATESSRQIFTLLKLLISVFTVLMTMIIGLNVCNTISSTIQVRRNEFAVLRSVGMTSGGFKKMLLLESALYGIKSLGIALPVSFLVHLLMYHLISEGMTPFVFSVNWKSYVTAVAVVAIVVIMATLFAFHSVEKVNLITASTQSRAQ